MQSKELVAVVEEALDDLKAVEVKTLDVAGLTSITDFMVIASGTSDRHVRSIADRVVEMAKGAGAEVLGIEGHEFGEWVLVDLADVVVHIMQPRVRDFYKLENLWNMDEMVDAGAARERTPCASQFWPWAPGCRAAAPPGRLAYGPFAGGCRWSLPAHPNRKYGYSERILWDIGLFPACSRSRSPPPRENALYKRTSFGHYYK